MGAGVNESPIDAYLGRLFDTLPGRGTSGWRLMVETEDHLRASADALMTSGMDATDAEREAVARFGDAPVVAAALDASRRLSWSQLLTRLVGAAWFVGAVALLSIGLSAPIALGAGAAFGKSAIAADRPGAVYSHARCDYLLEYYPQANHSCRDASIAHHFEEDARNRVAAGVLGAGALGALVWARRNRRPLRWLHPFAFTPSRAIVDGMAATGAGLIAVVAIGSGIASLVANHPWGAWANIASGIGALPAAAWFAWRTLRHARADEHAVAVLA